MEASYLRVKNQRKFQHYDPTKRRPPWIKAHTSLLGGDDRFMQLTELEQWQLFRIWLVAAGSTALTLDENGDVVPVVANDATTLQRAIMSAKKVPLPKFIRDGWLIPVAEDELLSASAVLAKPPSKQGADASAGASASLSSRGLEKFPKAVTELRDDARESANERPRNEHNETTVPSVALREIA